MEGKLLFLGTGASLGVPVIGCKCAVCQSKSAKNKRLRPAALLILGKKKLLIDSGPDFRQQGLKFGIDRLDGVLITHGHFDHIAGIDDLRIYYFMQKKEIPCLLSKDTFTELKMRYHYLFMTNGSLGAHMDFAMLPDDFGVINFLGAQVGYLSFSQRGMKVTGYRFGDLAYVSDIREYTDEVFEQLKGVKTLVLSALRHTPSKAHFSVSEAVAFAKKVKAKRTYLTHIAHDLDHNKTNKKLPKGVELAYDGLQIEFRYGR